MLPLTCIAWIGLFSYFLLCCFHKHSKGTYEVVKLLGLKGHKTWNDNAWHPRSILAYKPGRQMPPSSQNCPPVNGTLSSENIHSLYIRTEEILLAKSTVVQIVIIDGKK